MCSADTAAWPVKAGLYRVWGREGAMNKPHCFPPLILQIPEFLPSVGLDCQCPNPIMIFPGIPVQTFDKSPSVLHSCQSLLPLLLQQLPVGRLLCLTAMMAIPWDCSWPSALPAAPHLLRWRPDP